MRRSSVALHQKVFLQVVPEFLRVRHRSVGLVRALWQQHQIADTVAIIIKLAFLLELVPVFVKLVRPDVFTGSAGLRCRDNYSCLGFN
jgi:hypothetical protein